MKYILTTLFLLLTIDILAVQIHVETDRQNYYSGQELNVLVMAVNTQAVDVVLTFGASPQIFIEADGPCEDPGGLAVASSVTIPAYGTNVWSTEYDWNRFPLSAGPHTINGQVRGHGEATSEPFLVEQAVLPKDKVLIDFYSIPGTDVPALSLFAAYDACGVHFSTESTANCRLSVDGTNHRLKANWCTYPPGFNIIANLDFPVYGVSVDAYTSTGRQVTMLAKDSDGQIITSATTEPALIHVPQPIWLRASRRIETLEWWPSVKNAGVSIGNLCLHRQPSIFMERTQQMVTLHWASDVHSGLEVCTNLQDAVWKPLLSSIGTNEVSVPITNSPACFYRLKIEEDI